MVVFDKSNVYFMWDESLVGKSCYFADSVADLIRAVTRHDEDKMGVMLGFGTLESPFYIDLHGVYSMVYPVDGESGCIYSKSYVHFEWDESLEGRKGWMANSIGQIKSMLIRNVTPGYIYRTGCDEHPFEDIEGDLYRFAYYDPYYDFRYALLNGEPVEFSYTGGWRTLEHCVFSFPSPYYLLKSESGALSETSSSGVHEGTQPGVAFSDPHSSEKAKDVPAEEPEYAPVTVMELARWLSEGRGYCYDNETGKVVTHFPFDLIAKDCPYNKSRYLLLPWGTEIPLSEMNRPYPKCDFDSMFF